MVVAQPAVDLAVALAGKRRFGQTLAAQDGQTLVRHVGLGAAPARHRPPSPMVAGRARQPPDTARPLDAVASACARGGRPAHFLDLPRPKGARRSIRSIFRRKSSFSIVISPICRWAASS